MDTPTTISQLSIHEAAMQGDYKVVQAWLEKDPKLVDSRDSFENTPLHLATCEGHALIVKLLLDYKADPCAENWRKATPLRLIVQQREKVTNQYHEIVKLLLQAGIFAHQLTTLNKKDESLLCIAAANRHNEIVKLFLMHGANPNALDSEGKPVWYEASSDTLCIFLKHPNIDLNIPCKRFFFEDNKTILSAIAYEMKELILRANFYSPHLYDQYVQCLKYLIFSNADRDDEEIRQVCNQDVPGCAPVDFYPHIKKLIDEAVAIKEKAVDEFDKLGLPSLLIKHFLLSSGDTRKAFLKTANALLYLSPEYLNSKAKKNAHQYPLLRLPKEMLDQIMGEVLRDDYRFPNMASNEPKETSPRP